LIRNQYRTYQGGGRASRGTSLQSRRRGRGQIIIDYLSCLCSRVHLDAKKDHEENWCTWIGLQDLKDPSTRKQREILRRNEEKKTKVPSSKTRIPTKGVDLLMERRHFFPEGPEKKVNRDRGRIAELRIVSPAGKTYEKKTAKNTLFHRRVGVKDHRRGKEGGLKERREKSR